MTHKVNKLYVDPERQESALIVKVQYEEHSILFCQSLRERVFGPLYGSTIRLICKAEVPEEGEHWAKLGSSKVLRKEEVESAPTWFVGLCRKLFRTGT